MSARTQRRLKFYSQAPNTTSWSNIHHITTILREVLWYKMPLGILANHFLSLGLRRTAVGLNYVFLSFTTIEVRPTGPAHKTKSCCPLMSHNCTQKVQLYKHFWFYIFHVLCAFKIVIRWILVLRTGSWIFWKKSCEKSNLKVEGWTFNCSNCPMQ